MLILAAGLIRHYSFKASFTRITDQQSAYAKSIAFKDMQSRGFNPSEYEIKVMERARKMHSSGSEESLVPVSFKKDDKIGYYLIDLNTGRIMVFSYMEFSEGFIDGNQGRRPPHPWMMFGMRR